jgi:uncharacterized RDD family membrane protein YckC
VNDSPSTGREPASDRVPDAEALFALDNVRLDLPIAGAGSRALAAFLDYLLLGFLMTLWFFGAFFGLSLLGAHPGWGVGVALLGLFVLDWGYFSGFEILSGGRTPGKMAVGARVVSRSGGRAGGSAILVRNFVRMVDLLVGVPLMMTDPLARRLGDRLASTLVLREPRASSELALTRFPRDWGPREIAFAEAFLERVDELEPERALALSARVVAWIRRTDPSFLAGTAEDDPIQSLKHAFLSD